MDALLDLPIVSFVPTTLSLCDTGLMTKREKVCGALVVDADAGERANICPTDVDPWLVVEARSGRQYFSTRQCTHDGQAHNDVMIVNCGSSAPIATL